MKFMMTMTFKTEVGTRNDAIARFKETGGRPPTGVTLLGRWVGADFSGGFILLETNDPVALTEFALLWSDLVELKVAPVVEDPEIISALERARL